MVELPKRIAVTGAAGYVATRLIKALTRCANIDNFMAIDLHKPESAGIADIDYRRQDVGEPFSKLFVGCDIETVVHLAYDMNPGHDRRAVRKINVGGTENLLEACAAGDVKHILYLSTTSIYGAHADNPEALTEESSPRPLSGFQYSEGKAESEALLERYAIDHPECAVTILRACPVLGPNADNFVAAAFSKPFLVGVIGADPQMQFLHEDDLIDHMLVCLRQRPRGAYNLAGRGTVRWSEMAAIFGRRMVKMPAPILYGLASLGWKLRLQSDSPAAGIDFIRYRWVVDTKKIETELEMTPKYTSHQAWEAFATRKA